MTHLAIRDIDLGDDLDEAAMHGVTGGMGAFAFAVGMFAFRAILANTRHNGSDDDYPIITDEVRNAGKPSAA